MKWTYGTKWLTYDSFHQQTKFIWFIPQYDTLYSCGSLLPNLRADINLELPKVLKVLSVMLSILMIFFVLQHCYAIGEFWLVPRLRKGSIIWAQFYFWYCVTRAPLLYFIRSWVALSFNCDWVSESVRHR